MAAKLKKGDKVIVIAGRNKGQQGAIMSVNPTAHKVVVEGVNIVKRHMKPSQTSEGGIVERNLPIDISNVMLVGLDGKPTRVGFKVLKDGKKVRVAKRSGEVLDK
ncbi:MAG: 50S ribosomal protein L24 [Candidatus Margulisiibacteriota bacterium]|jgi:large subunit ribosomal protein L24